MKAYGFAGGFRSSTRITTLNVAAIALCLSLAVPGLALADDYRLGVMDKIRVRVAEWQTAEGAVRDWAAVSGDYSVGAAGQVSLPFIGELPASGKTTADVADEIGKRCNNCSVSVIDRPHRLKFPSIAPSTWLVQFSRRVNIPMHRV